ncbi:MAG: hypothetical protein IKC15_06220 [Kiritimatiellae bacterium]|nr:hypothetical protein [Kiritimatiellia bacterium]
MTISALAIAAAAVWPALDASDAAIYRSIHEPRVVAVQPNHTHKEMVLMPDGEVRYYGKDLVDGRPREVYLSSRDRGPDGKVEVRTNDTASTSLNFFRPVQPLEKSRRWIFAGARRIDGYERPARRSPRTTAKPGSASAKWRSTPPQPRLLSLLPQGPSAIAQIGKGSQNQNFKIF